MAQVEYQGQTRYIYTGLNIFSLHNFCSMLVEQLIDQKLKTENLKFRTDLSDLVMDDWSVTQ